jgi:chitin synthase
LRSTLPSIAEDTILASLRERYGTQQPYTAVGSSALVSINPLMALEANSETSLQDYVNEYYRSTGDDDVLDGPAQAGSLGPHIFRQALNAYYNMRRTGQDQIMVMT